MRIVGYSGIYPNHVVCKGKPGCINKTELGIKSLIANINDAFLRAHYNFVAGREKVNYGELARDIKRDSERVSNQAERKPLYTLEELRLKFAQ